MKDWEAMEETDMIFEKIYNRALARLQKGSRGRPLAGVLGAAPPRSFALKTKKGRGKLPAPDYQG